jgi:signal recognition particle receptor subunit beta
MPFPIRSDVAAESRSQPLIVQIVYDGPPEAGKTTSVRALGRFFGREVYTPEEREGRTVYFDWLEHVGGHFEGAPISFRIASVPGQERWLGRRAYFLERTHAVVFVGDTSHNGWSETIARLAELRVRLSARGSPPVGVVFQANRRDCADAVPIEEVRRVADSYGLALVESIAVDGTGVREAFVFAVRLALDHLREHAALGLPGAPEEPSASGILEVLRGLELPDAGQSAARAEDSAVGDTFCSSPAAPAHDVASGLVWPPVEGRIVLRAATRTPVQPIATLRGDFEAEVSDGFRLHSRAADVFTEVEVGRGALIRWARLHANAQELLSPRRCITLSETGGGEHRLWQVVRKEPSLRLLFLDGFERASGPATARLLAMAGRLLSEAQGLCAAAAVPLSCTLDTIGMSEQNRPIFIDLMPYPDGLEPCVTDPDEVAGELASLFREASTLERADVLTAVRATPAHTFGPWGGARIHQALTKLLEQPKVAP